jgi:tripartite-type tricarboxylate transporter receptor subunit TctC
LGFIAVFFARPVSAQDYPNREIHLICAFAAGSGADVIHRYFAEKLRVVAGVPVVVENKPGVSGNLAHSYVTKSKPDGYTVYPVGGSALASMMHLLKQPPIDPLKDLEPVGTTLKQGWLVLVDAKSPFKTLGDLTAHLKQKGDKASYSTSTATGIVTGELYKSVAGLKMVQVNYKTIGDSLNDLLSGNIDVMMGDAGFGLGQIRNGRLRALAVSTGTRMKAMSDIPTMAEGGVPGIDLTVWWATMVPAGTPPAIKAKLQAWFDQILAMPETEQFLANIGTDVFVSTPQGTTDYLTKEIQNWGEYVRKAGIKPE